MKLQTILCAAALVALPVVADVTGSNVCGWMKIASPLKNTIVAVPWVEVGTGDAIKVANLVKTDNLTAGDFLYVYGTDGKWYAYKLEGTPLAWTAVTTVDEKGVAVSEAPANQTLDRGSAIFLQRKDPSKPFYIYGQYKQSVGDQKKVTAGTTEAPAFSLVASPKDVAFNPNGTNAITNFNDDDKIIVPQNGGESLVYERKDGRWKYNKKTEVSVGNKKYSSSTWTEADEIPMGTGFWYVSQGTSAAILKW